MLKLAVKNLLFRKLSTALSMLLLIFGCTLISLLLLSKNQLEKQFIKNISSIDMVVGAKGSPLQLILSAVYQIDAPTGNIALSDFEKLKKNGLVQKAVPVSFGDSYKNFRIVGTTAEYLELYAIDYSANSFPKTGEVWLGSDVAQATRLKIGDTFYGNHGIQNALESHDDFAYTVTGILEPKGNVVDGLILTTLTSVWEVHNHTDEVHTHEQHEEHEQHTEHESHDEHKHHEEHQHADGEKEITAALVQFRGAMAHVMLPNYVNNNTPMMAALPAFEINRLFGLVSDGVFFLQILAVVIIIISGISVFVALYQSLQARKAELALLRSLGTSRFNLFTLICTEGFIVSMASLLFSILLSRGILLFIAKSSTTIALQPNWWVWLPPETYLCLGTLGIGFLASLLPAIQTYNINIPKALTNA